MKIRSQNPQQEPLEELWRNRVPGLETHWEDNRNLLYGELNRRQLMLYDLLWGFYYKINKNYKNLFVWTSSSQKL